MNVAQETLGFRRAGLSPALSLLMSAFALPIPPARVTPHLRRPTERSPTTPYAPRARLTPPSPTFGVADASTFMKHCRRASLWRARRQACWVERTESTASVHSLSPVTSSAQDDSTSELLRFL